MTGSSLEVIPKMTKKLRQNGLLAFRGSCYSRDPHERERQDLRGNNGSTIHAGF